MDNQEIKNLEIRKTFFDYWEDLQIVEMISPEQFKKIISQQARNFILSILADGIDDEYPGTGEILKRRVMSASELMKLSNEKLEKIGEEPVKKANFYFHLQKLELANLIRVVDTLVHGKRHTTYYGRMAKIFLHDNFDPKKYYKIHRDENFRKMIKKKDPDLPENEMDDILNVIEGLNNIDLDYFKLWIEQNQQAFQGIDIDFRRLESLVSIIRRFDAKVAWGFEKIGKLLDVDYTDKTYSNK